MTKRTDVDDGELVLVVDPQPLGRRLCASRLDESLTAEEFCDVLDSFEAAVRDDERRRLELLRPLPPPPPPPRVKAEHRAPIVAAYRKIKAERGGNAPRGTIKELAEQFGYTQTQISSIVYKYD